MDELPTAPTDYIYHGATVHAYNMTEVLAGYQEQFLQKMLIFAFLYLVLTLFLFFNLEKFQIEPDKKRILRIFVSFNLAPALYYPVLMIGIYTGWYQ